MKFASKQVRLRLPAILGLMLAVATVASFFGGPLWIQIAVAGIPFLALAVDRIGHSIGIPIVIVSVLLVLLYTLMVSAALNWSIVPSVALTFAVLGLLGCAILTRTEISSFPVTDVLVRWLAPCVGAVAWIATMAAAQFIPSASRLGWVMNGDSANNFLFAREIVYRGGISIGQDQNPVPLPAALLAVSMSPGRSDVASSELVEHDITAFAEIWSLMICLTCVLIGAAASAIIGKNHRIAIAFVGAGASFLPLTWYVTGYPIEYGFFNIHIALPLVLSCWIMFLGGRTSPLASVAGLLMAATVLLSVWGPLVLFPIAFIMAILARDWKSILRARGWKLLVLAVTTGQLIAYGILVTLPTLLFQGGYLGAAGGAYPFSRWLVPGLLICLLVFALIIRGRVQLRVISGWLTLSAACLSGLAVLAFAARSTPDPLASYYPLKYAWIVSIVAMAALLGYASAAAVIFFQNRLFTILALVVVAAGTLGYVHLAPSNRTGYATGTPILRILNGTFLTPGDESARKIFALSDPANPAILWESGVEFEGTIDFWLLQIKADSMSKNQDLRLLAYLYNPAEINDLCKIALGLGTGALIYTQNPELETKFGKNCAASSAQVVMGVGP